MPELSRREFCACFAAATLAASARGQNPPAGDRSDRPREPIRGLDQRGQPLVYEGDRLRQVAFPLGGIGTGYFGIGGRGQFCEWQIFNNVNKSARLPDTFLAVRVKAAGEPVGRVLQLDPVRDLPPVSGISFRGEYPLAQLTYTDPAMPVQLSLEAFCPMIPLNEEDSGIPGCYLILSATNTGTAACEVSFLASLQNAVGYTGYGELTGREHPAFGGNRAETRQADGLRWLSLGTAPAQRPAFAAPVRLFSLQPDHEMRVIAQLTKGSPDGRGDLPDPAALASNYDVIWIDRLPTGITDEQVSALAEATRRGATLLLTGGSDGLLPLAAEANAILSAAPESAENVFADFEGDDYGDWTVEGEAFGTAPARGTLPGQQAVGGFQGRGLVNTFLGGDEPHGKATSPPFRIEHRYIRFLIGGGAHQGLTCINLLVDGQVVRTATGRNNERLEPHAWDVGDLLGREAWIEIVDRASGGWGHINIDHITFGDTSAAPVGPETAQWLADLLPGYLDGIVPVAEPVRATHLTPDAPQALVETPMAGTVRPSNWALKPGARILAATADGSPLLVERRYGRGRVVLYFGAVEHGSPRWSERGRLAGALIALAGRTTYTPGTGVYPASPFYGTLALGTDSPEASLQASWTDPAALWRDFLDDGRLTPVAAAPTPPGETHNSALAVPFTLAPGETRRVRLYLAWHFPNQHRRFWGPPYEIRVGNAYNRRFADADAVIAYLHRERDRLETETRRFHDSLYDSTLPYWLLDAVSSQAAIVRTQTCMWFEDDFFGGFEGCGGGEGCCPLNCTHVWNYAQSVAALYPGLERRVRREDLGPQLLPNGVVGHRHMYPHGPRPAGGEATDGQCGTILKVYREHLHSANDGFLRSVWEGCRKALGYLLEQRDSDGDGILDGSQLHTYDVEMTGVSMFIQSLWLAALRAGEEMARRMGDVALAERCRATFNRASPALDALLWNGEYYIQQYDAAGHTRFQHGPGCLADQVVGQWWAHQLDLGDLLPREHVVSAIEAVFRHNYRDNFVGFQQRPRRFAFDDEPGLLCCTWPRGGRPEEAILYADEVWTGVEYQVAAHLIAEGRLDEGLTIAAAARARYRGLNRNPYNEIECGDNYARAMSSWSLLLAAQGFVYDGPAGRIGFFPRLTPDDHRSFFTAAEGWGSYATRLADGRREHELRLDHGKLLVRELLFPPGVAEKVVVTINGRAIAARAELQGDRLVVQPADPLTVVAGERLTVTAPV